MVLPNALLWSRLLRLWGGGSRSIHPDKLERGSCSPTHGLAGSVAGSGPREGYFHQVPILCPTPQEQQDGGERAGACMGASPFRKNYPCGLMLSWLRPQKCGLLCVPCMLTRGGCAVSLEGVACGWTLPDQDPTFSLFSVERVPSQG